jgi:hypothetical protein
MRRRNQLVALVNKGNYSIERASALCRIDVHAGEVVMEQFNDTGKTWFGFSPSDSPKSN